MQRKDGTYCPLIKEECIEFKCKFFQKVIGTNPQNGDPVDEYECAILLQNILLMENTKFQIQTGASVESLRNETVIISERQSQQEQQIKEAIEAFSDKVSEQGLNQIQPMLDHKYIPGK